jgi:hypothetical protein
MCTVPDAGRVLEIGRTLAYQLADKYLDTEGREGIPVIRIGRCLRVPRWALEVLAETGQVVTLSTIETPATPSRRPPNRTRRVVVRRASRAAAAVVLAQPSAVRPVSRVRRPRVGGRAGSVEQLRLLPGD